MRNCEKLLIQYMLLIIYTLVIIIAVIIVYITLLNEHFQRVNYYRKQIVIKRPLLSQLNLIPQYRSHLTQHFYYSIVIIIFIHQYLIIILLFNIYSFILWCYIIIWCYIVIVIVISITVNSFLLLLCCLWLWLLA